MSADLTATRRLRTSSPYSQLDPPARHCKRNWRQPNCHVHRYMHGASLVPIDSGNEYPGPKPTAISIASLAQHERRCLQGTNSIAVDCSNESRELKPIGIAPLDQHVHRYLRGPSPITVHSSNEPPGLKPTNIGMTQFG